MPHCQPVACPRPRARPPVPLLRAAERALNKSGRFEPTIANFLSSMVKYALWAVVLVTVLSQFGVETTSIIAALGGMALASLG